MINHMKITVWNEFEHEETYGEHFVIPTPDEPKYPYGWVAPSADMK